MTGNAAPASRRSQGGINGAERHIAGKGEIIGTLNREINAALRPKIKARLADWRLMSAALRPRRFEKLMSRRPKKGGWAT